MSSPLFLVLLLSVATVAAWFAGYQTTYRRLEDAGRQETFYAEITRITGTPEEGNAVTVQGLAVNDRNYRGTFSFAVYGETSIEWHGTPLDFEALEVGDRISITFTGPVTESSPAALAHVERIQLLDDAL